MQTLNIKIKRSYALKIAIVGAALFSGLIFASPAQAAPSVEDLCKDKKRAKACVKAVKKSCDKKNGSEKESCQKKRAGDFKAKAAAAGSNEDLLSPQYDDTDGGRCGHTDTGNSVETRFDFGCLGNEGPTDMNSIEDLLYSLIRFLSAGIGIVIVIFIILAGIQYSASEGNPEATQAAKNKIRDAIIGLIIYLIAFAFVQFLVPGGVFTGTMFTPGISHSIIQGLLW